MNVVRRLFASFSRHPGSVPKAPRWYTGPPTFPAQHWPAGLQPYTPVPLPLDPTDAADVTQVPRQPGEPGESLEDTKPRRLDIPESAPSASTQATETIYPTTHIKPGAYDYLFPPAQPGDEDYLEVDPSQQTPPPENLPQ